ncbi:MAG: hypothetical protein ACOC9P_00800 [bacterium]
MIRVDEAVTRFLWAPALVVALMHGAFAAPASAAAADVDLTLAVADRLGVAWADEPIHWDASLQPSVWDGRGGVRVTRDGEAVPAQITVRGRHDDGSVARATISLVIDQLAADGTTTLRAQFGETGPTETDLELCETDGYVVLANKHIAVRLPGGDTPVSEHTGPILGVRLPSGDWTEPSRYRTETTELTSMSTRVLERGPVRLVAEVTSTFTNGKTHVTTFTLMRGSHAVEVAEHFDLGPSDMYHFKSMDSAKDRLAWEWWQWYGDTTGQDESHPNYWDVPLYGSSFTPTRLTYRGLYATDSAKGPTDSSKRGRFDYAASHDRDRRLEKYLAPRSQWRPDSATWVMATTANPLDADLDAPALAAIAHSTRKWRNPNVLPLTKGITLRTGTNDMRVVSYDRGERIVVRCPVGLGRRVWSLYAQPVGAMLAERMRSPDGPTALYVQHGLGLDVTRHWITQWESDAEHPRLFTLADNRATFLDRMREVGELKDQSDETFDAQWQEAEARADKMIDGYLRHGFSGDTYPGWMLGAWHGNQVAWSLDLLAGSERADPETVERLRRKLAILTNCLVSKDAWPDKRINYGWGSMNMPVTRWGALVIMTLAVGDHPAADRWLADAEPYYRMLLETEYNAHGVHVSCPHYIKASATSFYAWLAMARNGVGHDVSNEPTIARFARYYMQLMPPIDRRWGIRTLLTEGDTRPGSSGMPAVLASLLRESQPELAGQLMTIWREGGRVTGDAMGIPYNAVIDPDIEPRPLTWSSHAFPGFGAVLRYRDPGTPQEAYLTFLAGGFMLDHVNSDQLAFSWYENGSPLTLYKGDMYKPAAVTALSHNTIAWNVQPRGAPCPGKGEAGCWYHDHGEPWVDHDTRPRLHQEIAFDKSRQHISGSRGELTVAAETSEAAALEGRVRIFALSEIPTRNNFSRMLQAQQDGRHIRLDAPATWTRRLIYIRDENAEGLNYLVVRDTFEGTGDRVPSFSYWSMAEGVEASGAAAHFDGQFDVDTTLHMLQPTDVKWTTDRFTHTEAESIVKDLHRQRHDEPFSETQWVARAEGNARQGFFAAVVPHADDGPAPRVEPWLDGSGLKLTAANETHRVLLAAQPVNVQDGELEATAAALVLKEIDDDRFILSLPRGGTATYRGHELTSDNPVTLHVSRQGVQRVPGRDLLAEADQR